METLTIRGTPKLPMVNLDAEKGLVEIKGRSIPENSIAFYEPLVNWLNEYSKNPQPQTVFNIHLEYFNTSSSKCILDVFKKAENIHNDGKSKVVVNWYYEEDDDDMLEAGEDYQSIVDLPFEMIAVEE
ncbi:MAG: nuclear pore complex subunit [Flavobacteriales bacterium]|nr:MAG: nuclear pore complex subunit [Flavobacteriales bacterium]